MLDKRQNYINTLMDLYKDMLDKNNLHDDAERKRRAKHIDDNKLNIKKEYFYSEYKPYSDTMLHSIITILHKLNNNDFK